MVDTRGGWLGKDEWYSNCDRIGGNSSPTNAAAVTDLLLVWALASDEESMPSALVSKASSESTSMRRFMMLNGTFCVFVPFLELSFPRFCKAPAGTCLTSSSARELQSLIFPSK